ncbi:MAG: Molybdopterin-guanine dinucleotide biosynthesis protein MobB [Hydrogenibacillus schlegelii]|uniref:Molybdopterin-guanine dinucleotide biosynthesis protein MobB n=2 Tax=Hydrogenibacillus schlegelii TaxID=1484 RepID=A0A2T5GDY3_HYDSH|nr:MAG: Molybdopterin-guanine dinucleotide biosynthesis protein MobB [Hydrogenibacillus schlegelii]
MVRNGAERMERIVHVAGFSGSGKTTLIARLIERAAADGIRAAVIKHHAHAGAVPPDRPRKDTAVFGAAGAVLRGLLAPEGALLYWTPTGAEGLPAPAEAEALARRFWPLARAFGADWLFVEGFKTAPGPKLALLRSADDLPAALTWPDVIALVAPADHLARVRAVGNEAAVRFPLFAREDAERIYRWVIAERRFRPEASVEGKREAEC